MKILLGLLLIAQAAFATAATPLFPRPLHLLERVEDPFASKPATVDQYCHGNRIVTVAGQRVSIVDYDAQTITLIDHAQGTYSRSRFEEVAAAHPRAAAADKVVTGAAPQLRANGVQTSRGGRSVDSYSIEFQRLRVEVGVDRSWTLSRAAIEALIGASYPSVRRPEHDAILEASAPSGRTRIATNSTGKNSTDSADYALPLERSLTMESEGGPLTSRTSVIRYDEALAPASATLIEPGAKLVEAPATRFAREMHEADTIPTARP